MAEETAGGGAGATVHVDDRALLDDLTVLAQPASAAPEAGESRQSQESERGGGITELAAIQQGTPTLAAQFIPATPDTGAARDAGDGGRNPGYGPGNTISAIDAARPTGPDGGHPADAGTASAPIAAVAAAAVAVQSAPAAATEAAPIVAPTAPTAPVSTAVAAPTAPAAEPHTAAAAVDDTAAASAPVQPTALTASVGIPTIAAQISVGDENTPIPLHIQAGTTHSGDALGTVTIMDVPSGASFTDANGNPVGTDAGSGTWQIPASALGELTLIPPHNFIGTINLMVQTTATDTGLTATSAQAPFIVDVNGQSAHAAGNENAIINLNLAQYTDAASDNLGLTIANVASGSHFYADAAGTQPIGATSVAANGTVTWTFTSAEIAQASSAGHEFFIKPPTDWNDYDAANVGMQLTATLTGGADSAPLNFTVNVAAIANTPTVTVSGTHGSEDRAIPLTISAATTDVADTEVISAITISGVPSGAVLNHGTENADGTWTLTTHDLTGLTITPPSHSAADFTLTVTSTSSELGSNIFTPTATSTSSTLLVQVDALAHAPTVTQANAAAGNEDTRINLNLSEALAPTVGNEALTLTLSGVATGSAFYASASGGAALGTDNHDGTWSFTSGEVAAIQSGGIYLVLRRLKWI